MILLVGACFFAGATVAWWVAWSLGERAGFNQAKLENARRISESVSLMGTSAGNSFVRSYELVLRKEMEDAGFDPDDAAS